MCVDNTGVNVVLRYAVIYFPPKKIKTVTEQRCSCVRITDVAWLMHTQLISPKTRKQGTLRKHTNPVQHPVQQKSTMENTTYNKGDKLMTNLEGFEKLIEDTVSGGLHTMVLALGHRVGLVETFFRLGRPATAREISKEAGLNLRYRFYFILLWLTS